MDLMQITYDLRLMLLILICIYQHNAETKSMFKKFLSNLKILFYLINTDHNSTSDKT